MALTVWLNGQERTLPGVEDGAFLASVVAELGLNEDRIAVEKNGEIARRSGWATAAVRSGDKLEVVHFVGGGSRSGDPPSKLRPTYAGAFRCIGPACEDHCCQSWDIPVDKATYEQYALFPADRLGWAVSGFVSASTATVPASLHATIHMAASGECPFLEADRLCGIQKAYGPALLSSTCSSYPRALNRVDGELEGSLSLSCPEAARNVLLEEGFLDRVCELEGGAFRTDNFFWLGDEATSSAPKPFAAFHAVRQATIELVRDRSRPIWLRLLRVGALCQRLEAAANLHAAEDAIAAILGGETDRELMALPSNRKLRLEMAMQLSEERIRDRDRNSGSRFQATYWAFVEGIASDAASASGDDLERLAFAEKAHYRPYLEAHPHLLENLLVNYIYQRLFPFGRAGGADLGERGIFEEFVLLASQVGWMETLLTGVAARHGMNFGEAHVVETIQSFHRAVEHYADVLEGVVGTMRERGMSNLAGMSAMLR